MKVSTIINRALRLLEVVDVGDPTQAADSTTAILALNQMCRRWEANGLAMGWADVAAVDDDLPAPPEAELAITFNLAVQLAAEYPLSDNFQLVATQAKDFLNELRRDRLTEMPLQLRSDLPAAYAWGRWNIYTDEPYYGGP